MFDDRFLRIFNRTEEDKQELDGARIHDRFRRRFWASLILIPLIYTEALGRKQCFLDVAHCLRLLRHRPPSASTREGDYQAGCPLDSIRKLVQPRAIPKDVARSLAKPSFPPDVINKYKHRAACSAVLLGQGTVFGSFRTSAPTTRRKLTGPGAHRAQGGKRDRGVPLLRRRDRLYPALARQARIQGNVVLHAIIDKDGKAAPTQWGSPVTLLLVQAALDAVKQWRL